MAIISTGTLGGTGTNQALVTNSSVWAGGTTTFEAGVGTDDQGTNKGFSVERNGVVYAAGKHIVGQYGDSTNSEVGLLSLEDCTIDLTNNGGGSVSDNRTMPLSLQLNNVTITRTKPLYSAWGAWNAGAAGSVPDWTNVNIYGDIDADLFLSYSSPFYAAVAFMADYTDEDGTTITANLRFDNVRFWNGEALASGRALGGTPQLSTAAPIVSTVLGPFGLNLQNSGGRCVFRLANSANGPDVRLNNNTLHRGLITNLDMRGVAQMSALVPAYISVDNGPRASFINPLLATQAGVEGTYVVSQFTAGTTLETSGWTEFWVGSNPVTSADSGEHTFTFGTADIVSTEPADPVNASTARGVVMPPAGNHDIFNTTWNFITNPVVTDTSNGILWRQFSYNTIENGLNIANIEDHGAQIVALEAPTYRKYSFLQQPDNTTWGREITVSVPPLGATDEQLQTARDGGFDTHDGATWSSSTNVDDPSDQYTVAAGFTTAAAAVTGLTPAGSVNIGSHVPTILKATAFGALTNTHAALPYSFNGMVMETTLNLAVDATATFTSSTTNATLPVPAAGIAADANIDGLKTSGTIVISNGALGSAQVNSAFTYEADQTISFNNAAAYGVFTAGTGLLDIPTTIPSGMVLNGTYSTASAADSTLTFGNAEELSGLTINNTGTGTITIIGAFEADFAAVNGNVAFQVNYTIENARTAGLLTVFRNGTPETLVDGRLNDVMSTDVVQVVYSETGRSDFYENVAYTGSPLTVTVATENQGYPQSETATASVFTPVAVTGSVLEVAVAQSVDSATDVNQYLQEQIKATLQYNTLVRNVGAADQLSSQGALGFAQVLDAANWNFTSPSPYVLGFVLDVATSRTVAASTEAVLTYSNFVASDGESGSAGPEGTTIPAAEAPLSDGDVFPYSAAPVGQISPSRLVGFGSTGAYNIAIGPVVIEPMPAANAGLDYNSANGRFTNNTGSAIVFDRIDWAGTLSGTDGGEVSVSVDMFNGVSISQSATGTRTGDGQISGSVVFTTPVSIADGSGFFIRVSGGLDTGMISFTGVGLSLDAGTAYTPQGAVARWEWDSTDQRWYRAISVGVTFSGPPAFDANITASQIRSGTEDVVGQLATRFDTVDTNLNTVDIVVDRIDENVGRPNNPAATGDTASLHARQKTIEADTHDMRSNRLLGLKPQSVQS